MKKNTYLTYTLTCLLYLVTIGNSLSQCCSTGGEAVNVSWSDLVNYGYNNPGYRSYTRVTGLTIGSIYTIGITGSGCSAANVYLSITTHSSTPTCIANGTSSVTFTATATSHRIYYHSNSSCSGSVGLGCNASGNTNGTRMEFELTSPLSVDLTSLTGHAGSQGNQLNWQTASETNNDYFELQSTTDGINFNTIGKIRGAGTSKERNDYDFFDYTSEQITYYRLKQVDFDGKYTYHPIILVDRAKSKEIIVSPNPVMNMLHVDLNVNNAGMHHFSFINIPGTSVEKSFVLEKGNNRVAINVSDEFADGFYILRITDNSGTVIGTNKFVKK